MTDVVTVNTSGMYVFLFPVNYERNETHTSEESENQRVGCNTFGICSRSFVVLFSDYFFESLR